LRGLTSQKTHQGGLGLGGSVHEEAHPCFPCFIQPSFKGIDASIAVSVTNSGKLFSAPSTPNLLARLNGSQTP